MTNTNLRRSHRAHDLATARDIGSCVLDFCGLLVGFALFLALLGGCSARDVSAPDLTAGWLVLGMLCGRWLRSRRGES